LQQALRDLKEGFCFIFVEHRLLIVLMAISSIFTLGATGFIYLLPVIGKEIFQASAFQIGWLWAALSGGILITTMWLLLTKPIDLCRRVWMIAGAAGLAGGASLLLAWTNSLLFAAFFIAVVGASSGLVNPFVSASLQERSPKELLARVFSVFNTGYLAFAMIGMTLFGWLADAFNPVLSVVSVGVVSLAAGAFTVVMLPWCYRYRRAEAGKQALAATGTG
jgi:MFS family permease